MIPTSEVRATLSKITKCFDAGDTEPVFFGLHRRRQAVLVPITVWEKLLEYAVDELDVDLVRRCLADDCPWLSEDELAAALQRAVEESEQKFE